MWLDQSVNQPIGTKHKNIFVHFLHLQPLYSLVIVFVGALCLDFPPYFKGLDLTRYDCCCIDKIEVCYLTCNINSFCDHIFNLYLSCVFSCSNVNMTSKVCAARCTSPHSAAASVSCFANTRKDNVCAHRRATRRAVLVPTHTHAELAFDTQLEQLWRLDHQFVQQAGTLSCVRRC